ncbi:MAG: hypothetical protein ACE37D_09930 [Pseudomonadales bacterium]
MVSAAELERFKSNRLTTGSFEQPSESSASWFGSEQALRLVIGLYIFLAAINCLLLAINYQSAGAVDLLLLVFTIVIAFGLYQRSNAVRLFVVVTTWISICLMVAGLIFSFFSTFSELSILDIVIGLALNCLVLMINWLVLACLSNPDTKERFA